MIKTIEHAAKVQIRREGIPRAVFSATHPSADLEPTGTVARKRDVAAAVKRYLKRANRNSSCLRIEMAAMGVHS